MIARRIIMAVTLGLDWGEELCEFQMARWYCWTPNGWQHQWQGLPNSYVNWLKGSLSLTSTQKLQVVIQEEQHVKISSCWWIKIVSFWRPHHSKQEYQSRMETLQEGANQENSEPTIQLADTVQKLETVRLTEELARINLEAENRKLTEELWAAKERMWQMTCEQGQEQEELLVAN